MGGESTREQIIRAAERLFAERTIDSVSLSEIATQAGQKNRSATHYHFGDKKTLVHAIVTRHSEAIEAQWSANLALLERQNNTEMRPLIETLVYPVMDKLDDPDGGPQYVEICAQMATSHTFPLLEVPLSWSPGVLKLSHLVLKKTSSLPLSVLRMRVERVIVLLYCGVARFGRFKGSRGAPSVDVYRDDLVDCIAAVMSVPPAEQTRGRLKGFDARTATFETLLVGLFGRAVAAIHGRRGQ